MADPLTDTLNRRAAFAQNFPNVGGDAPSQGNLDQRRRFAQDITEASARQEERDAADFEALQQKNPALMKAVTGRMAEDRLFQEGRQKAGLAERKFGHQKEREVTIDDINERRLKMQEDNGKVDRRKKLMDIDRAERERDDTFAYEAGEMQLRDEFGPGTEDYRKGVLELAASLPYLNKSIRQESLKELGFEDPDAVYREVSDRLKTAKKEGIEFRETVKTKQGTMTLADRPDSTSKGNVDLGRLDRLKQKMAPLLNVAQDKMTEEQKDLLGYYKNEIAAIDKQRQEAAPSTPSTQGSPVPSAAPSPAGKTVWKADAQGNRFEYDIETKKPTGQYMKAK